MLFIKPVDVYHTLDMSDNLFVPITRYAFPILWQFRYLNQPIKRPSWDMLFIVFINILRQ